MDAVNKYKLKWAEQSTSEQIPSRSGSTSTTETSNVKLPTISLPSFTGNYNEWLPYIELFMAMIDNNEGLSNVQKLQYLQSTLKGEAYQTIKSLEITNANYTVALQLLKQRYKNPRIITQTHIREMFAMPSIQKESTVALRKLVDCTLQHLRALKSLGRPVDSWDDLIVYLICTKLDNKTRRGWEQSIEETKPPTMKELEQFLSVRCRLLETLGSEDNQKTAKSESRRTMIVESKGKCSMCGSTNHFVYKCEEFLQLPISGRIERARRERLCLNCLKFNHNATSCKSSGCRECGKKHNTLLHLPINEAVQIEPNTPCTSVHVSSSSHHTNVINYVLLSTAILLIKNQYGKYHKARALLDSGSQVNIMTTKLIRQLGLPNHKERTTLTGINGNQAPVIGTTSTRIRSTTENYDRPLTFLILDRITGHLPGQLIDTKLLKIPNNLTLADPLFYQSGEIDLLIGAELYFELMCTGQIKSGTTILQKSRLGWILGGTVPLQNTKALCGIALQELNLNVEKFWKIDNIDDRTSCTAEEHYCEKFFKDTTRRDETGRFIVSLPFKDDIEKLGESYGMALRRFYNIEKKLLQRPALKLEYSEFIHEYEELGHMKKLKEYNPNEKGYFLPHHAVIKEDSITTKLRVVFDASAKSTSGISLNDLLMVGPVVQEDLFMILLRFRTHKYVLSADITKMYRQIQIEPSQTKVQRILWRNNINEDVQVYELSTLTYGVASASYLATRCIKQLAEEGVQKFPTASKIATRDFYVDDLLTGAETVEEAIIIRNQVSKLLQSGGFQLRKWKFNNNLILKDMDHSNQEHHILSLDKDKTQKTLGIYWNTKKDIIQYMTAELQKRKKSTKRIILSEVSKLFDPLGLMTPVTITARILIQGLWEAKTNWDESVDQQTHTKWQQYCEELQLLNNIKIEINVIKYPKESIEIFGFSDASELAYGAAVYIKNGNKHPHVQLLSARARVAPMKQISLPRLELCAALVLAKLVKKIRTALEVNISRIHLFTDSTITLGWIKSDSRKWKTFVANRVGEIHSLTDQNQWWHVRTHENPADLCSRGLSSGELVNNELWWHGPKWLLTNQRPEQPCNFDSKIMPDLKALTAITIPERELFIRYSSANKLIRITAWIMRFFKKTHQKAVVIGTLTLKEIMEATNLLVMQVQKEAFIKEISCLKAGLELPRKSKLLCLNPFLDNNGIIRVGGRLQKALLPVDHKHQIVLPSQHNFTKLLISQEHKLQLHAGLQSTLASLRGRYWILSARSTVRGVPHFGGIWEAAVKSFKHHLKRVASDANLTYAEMNTLVCQIEAILNSRPLTPMSEDPNDLHFLTPGHFLIGDVITSIPEPSLLDIKVNRLSRWQHIQQMQQHFWRRWSKEYLNELQTRTKWKTSTTGLDEALQAGKMVLIRDDNTPSFQWKLGRIVETFPGMDDVPRIASVKMSTGTTKRAITRLCPLPIEI